MKKWYMTRNHQILDLNRIKNFWVEEVPGPQFIVFCKDDDGIDWKMEQFNNPEDAYLVLDDIYDYLE